MTFAIIQALTMILTALLLKWMGAPDSALLVGVITGAFVFAATGDNK